eukprot:1175610-Prymnesium_polylepis.1
MFRAVDQVRVVAALAQLHHDVHQRGRVRVARREEVDVALEDGAIVTEATRPVVLAGEGPRLEKVEEHVELGGVVLQRRPRQQQHVVEGEGAQRVEQLRLGVLEPVRFVDDEAAPVHRAEVWLALGLGQVDQLKGGDDHVELVDAPLRVALEPPL